MTELSRYRVWYWSGLGCKKTTVKFLVTLLILSSFPEKAYMAQQHYRRHSFHRRQQPFVQPTIIFHLISMSPVKSIVPTVGAMRNEAKVKGD